MPELPEVETVRLGLKALLPGQRIKGVLFDTAKSFPNAASDIEEFMKGTEVTDVRRRAKVLIIDLSSQYSLIVHLKMTGQMVFRGEHVFGAGHPNDSLIGELPDKSTRVIIEFENGGKAVGLEPDMRKRREAEQGVRAVRRASIAGDDKIAGQERWTSYGLVPNLEQRGPRLYFNDQRKFGWMRLVPTIEIENIDFFRQVGPEPLSDDFTAAVFIERLMKRKNTSIKAALLDQTVLAGIGNIYADESLWGAKIHPAAKITDIPKARLATLYKELQFVLRLAIEKGGSTDRNYVNAEGKKGSYMSFARVFRREKLPCPRCGHTIEKSKVAGRGTHICPHCQRLPK